MEKLTKRTSSVLDVLDAQIADLEERLKKAQPLIDELNKLKQTRRVLLSEKSVTGGGGKSGPQLSMEEVVRFLKENGPSSPQDIAEAVGFDVHRVRSHLSRGKGTRYSNPSNGTWGLVEDDADADA